MAWPKRDKHIERDIAEDVKLRYSAGKGKFPHSLHSLSIWFMLLMSFAGDDWSRVHIERAKHAPVRRDQFGWGCKLIVSLYASHVTDTTVDVDVPTPASEFLKREQAQVDEPFRTALEVQFEPSVNKDIQPTCKSLTSRHSPHIFHVHLTLTLIIC